MDSETTVLLSENNASDDFLSDDVKELYSNFMLAQFNRRKYDISRIEALGKLRQTFKSSADRCVMFLLDKGLKSAIDGKTLRVVPANRKMVLLQF